MNKAWDDEYTEGRLSVRDGRTVAWTDWGDPHGRPLLRLPGTPGSRWAVRADTSVWSQRGLRVVTTERPGFGASSRLPGRGFREHADDLAEILDHLRIDRVHLYGSSGAAPHELALCQYHPDRVAAATVVSGSAPLLPEEVEEMTPHNAESYRMIRRGARDELVDVLTPLRDQMLADPMNAMAGLMATASPADLAVMTDPDFRAVGVRSVREAIGQGIDGWIDEGTALYGTWPDLNPGDLRTSLTWYHALEDRLVPISAARQLADQIPGTHFIEWRDAGHLTAYHLESEILDELLARG